MLVTEGRKGENMSVLSDCHSVLQRYRTLRQPSDVFCDTVCGLLWKISG